MASCFHRQTPRDTTSGNTPGEGVDGMDCGKPACETTNRDTRDVKGGGG